MIASKTLSLLVLAAFACSAAAARGRILIEGGTWTKGANGEDIYVNPPQKADTCTNVAPDQRYTCQQQKDFGACDAEFMKKGNYCLYTCGRCPSGSTQQEKGEGEKKQGDSGNQGGSSDQGGSGKQGGSGSQGGGAAGGFAAPGNPNVCDDIQPNQQYTCQQQRDFGKCREWYIVDNHFCAKTCGLAPCPPVANLPVRNGTSTSISQRRPRTNSTTTTPAADAVNATVPETVLTPVTTTTLPVTTPPIAASLTPAVPANASEAVVSDDLNATAPVTGALNATEVPLASPGLENVTALPVASPALDAVTTTPVAPVVTTTAPLATPAPAAANFTEPVDANATLASPAVGAANETLAAPALETVNATLVNATLVNATLVNATLATPADGAENATVAAPTASTTA